MSVFHGPLRRECSVFLRAGPGGADELRHAALGVFVLAVEVLVFQPEQQRVDEIRRKIAVQHGLFRLVET